MMTVDGYFKQNGRQFVKMEGYDGESVGSIIKFKEPRKIEASDLFGRKYVGVQIFSPEDER